MTISMTGMTTGSNLHGTIKPASWDFARTVQSFFGVTGEFHLQGKLRGRELVAWMQFTGYNSHSSLQAAIETLNAYMGESGTVTWAVGSDSKTFSNSVFDGFTADEDPWIDASGVFGWQCRGVLKWRQIKT